MKPIREYMNLRIVTISIYNFITTTHLDFGKIDDNSE